MKRIIITGSRDWTDSNAIFEAIDTIAREAIAWDQDPTIVIRHGGCRGADAIAEDLAKKSGYVIEEFPANWDDFGYNAGPIRNQEMVDKGADYCLAFPMAKSRGTWDCIKRAVAAKIETRIFGG